MDRALKANIEALFKSKRGFEFEALIKEFLLIQYGSNGYSPTRERSDDGAEGLILSTKTITAVYDPDKYEEKKFIKKINDDFDNYLNKWAKENPNWKMFYNNSITPEQIRITDKLKQKAKKKKEQVKEVHIQGIDQIMQVLEEEFTNRQLGQLAKYLGVNKEVIIFDHIRDIIDDLIRGLPIGMDNINYGLEVDIEEKIRLNYTNEEAKIAHNEYLDLATDGTLNKIWAIISTYENEEVTILKFKIKQEFNNLQGSFKSKLDTLTKNYLKQHANEQDNDFEYYTRALFVYCFEQCMIGEKTTKEKANKKS